MSPDRGFFDSVAASTVSVDERSLVSLAEFIDQHDYYDDHAAAVVASRHSPIDVRYTHGRF